MKHKIHLFLFIFFYVSVLQTKAQNIKETATVWQADSVHNLKNSDHFAHACEFRVNTLSNIEWIQKNGAVTFTFNIVSSEGQWSDVTTPGKMIYHVTHEGKAGIITIERTEGKTSVDCDLSPNDPEGIHYLFHITQVNTLNEP